MMLHVVLGPVSQKILSPLVMLSMEKTMVAMVIGEIKSISRLKISKLTPSVVLKQTSIFDGVISIKYQ